MAAAGTPRTAPRAVCGRGSFARFGALCGGGAPHPSRRRAAARASTPRSSSATQPVAKRRRSRPPHAAPTARSALEPTYEQRSSTPVGAPSRSVGVVGKRFGCETAKRAARDVRFGCEAALRRSRDGSGARDGVTFARPAAARTCGARRRAAPSLDPRPRARAPTGVVS